MLKIFLAFSILFIERINGLYPHESASRSKISLNGLWRFKADLNFEGFANRWFEKDFKFDVRLYLY